MQGNLTALLITVFIVLTVVLIGFIAGRNKSSRSSVEEWSVGGRRFGGLLVWFLVGADLYTAYTFRTYEYSLCSGKSRILCYSLLYYRLFYFLLLPS